MQGHTAKVGSAAMDWPRLSHVPDLDIRGDSSRCVIIASAFFTFKSQTQSVLST